MHLNRRLKINFATFSKRVIFNYFLKLRALGVQLCEEICSLLFNCTYQCARARVLFTYSESYVWYAVYMYTRHATVSTSARTGNCSSYTHDTWIPYVRDQQVRDYPTERIHTSS